MISKSLAKLIKSLQIKKHRQRNQLFVVEGLKPIKEVLKSKYEIQLLLGTDEFLFQFNDTTYNKVCATPNQIASLGTLTTNNYGLAIVKMLPTRFSGCPVDKFSIVLDEVKDPSNLGTIIRIADWYGIEQVISSPNSVDFYNSKVIATSMGSFVRVNMVQCNILDVLSQSSLVKYGAVMDGMPVYDVDFSTSGIIVMGNESNGISKSVHEYINQPITIPRVGGCESLNVGVAMGIICDNIVRKNW